MRGLPVFRAVCMLLVLVASVAAPAWAAKGKAPTGADDRAAISPEVVADEADALVRLVHAPLLSEQPKRVLSQYAQKAADEAAKAHPAITEQQKAQLAVLPTRIGDLVQKNLKWDALLAAYAKIYRRVYTPEEIKVQLNFYRTKEGASILGKQMQLTSQLMLQSSVTLKPVYAKLQKLIDDQVKSILVLSPPLSSSSPG